jgi:hypothetical protein
MASQWLLWFFLLGSLVPTFKENKHQIPEDFIFVGSQDLTPALFPQR